MLMSTDMELSCDEHVLKKTDAHIKKPYANSLLSLATEKHILNGSPLAFGEKNIKGRIKNVLNYKKPRFWVGVFSVVAAIAIGVGLLLNPLNKDDYISFNRIYMTTYDEAITASTRNLSVDRIKKRVYVAIYDTGGEDIFMARDIAGHGTPEYTIRSFDYNLEDKREILRQVVFCALYFI